MSDIEKIDTYVSQLPTGTYVCEIYLQYDHEHTIQCVRTIVCVDIEGYATWLDDWYEGQQNIYLHKCVEINNLILY